MDRLARFAGRGCAGLDVGGPGCAGLDVGGPGCAGLDVGGGSPAVGEALLGGLVALSLGGDGSESSPLGGLGVSPRLEVIEELPCDAGGGGGGGG